MSPSEPELTGPGGPVAPAPPPPDPSARRLHRSRSDRMVAGVCGGLGTSLGVDPIWFRLAFLVLVFGSGGGLVLYIAAWILMPEEGEETSPDQHHPLVSPSRGSLIAGLALVAVGTMLLANRLVPGLDDVMWPLAVIAAGAGLLYAGSRR